MSSLWNQFNCCLSNCFVVRWNLPLANKKNPKNKTTKCLIFSTTLMGTSIYMYLNTDLQHQTTIYTINTKRRVWGLYRFDMNRCQEVTILNVGTFLRKLAWCYHEAVTLVSGAHCSYSTINLFICLLLLCYTDVVSVWHVSSSEWSDGYVNIFVTLSMSRSNKTFSLSEHAACYGSLFE